jgi:hypothetical protein
MGKSTKRPTVDKRRRMSEPEPTERPTKAIDRKFRRELPPVGSLAPANQQVRASQHQRRSEGREEKSVGEGHLQEQFATRFPALESQGFEEQFRGVE